MQEWATEHHNVEPFLEMSIKIATNTFFPVIFRAFFHYCIS